MKNKLAKGQGAKDAASAKTQKIDTAMVLAAGLGTRMRPLTDDRPKPMVVLDGRPMIDHVLDRLAEAGVCRAVVNVHYFADLLEAHLSARTFPAITIADERALVLDTGGGVKNALSALGDAPFFVHNSDSVWIEKNGSNIARMIAAFDPARMDTLLLLADRTTSLGYSGRGDFALQPDGQIRRRVGDETVPFVFTGVSIAHPRMFADAPEGVFSLNALWDRSIAAGRIFGLAHDGLWMHVGTPEALADAEALIKVHTPGG